MDIQIKQAELEIAVRQYVAAMGITAPINSVSFNSTRNPTGIVAAVDVGQPTAVATGTATPTVALVAETSEETEDASEAEQEPEATDDQEPVNGKSSIFGG